MISKLPSSLKLLHRSKKSIPLFLFISAFLLVLTTFNIENSFAQDQETIETEVGSVSNASDEGPSTSVSMRLRRNANNPDDNVFSEYLPETTVTFTLDNFNPLYYHIHNTNGNDADSDNPQVIFGWYFNNFDNTQSDFIGEVFLANGDNDVLVNSLNYISNPTNGYYTSSQNNDNNPEGIDIATNYGVLLSGGFQGLYDLPMADGGGVPIDYDLADLTITFSEPVTNPIIHFGGVGANWDATANFPSSGGVQNYFNSATLEFDLIDSDPGTVNLSVLSGSVNLALENTDKIINDNDVLNDNYISDTEGAAHGSVLVEAENVTMLEFRVYVRSQVNPDEGFGWAGGSGWTHNGSQMYMAVDGGGNIETSGGQAILKKTNDGNDILAQYYIAEDAIMLGVSADIQADETLLTVAECYRMLSSPVNGTTYSTLLDPLWTQGMTGSDYPSGDANVWLWPDVSGTNDSGWNAVSNLGDVIPAGSGFLMSVFEDDVYGTPGSFSKTLSVTGSENAPLTFTNMNSDASGWTLLGNPFKSPLFIATASDGIFEGATQDVVETVYIWDRNTESGNGGDNSTDDLPGSWITGTSGGAGDIFNDDGTIAPFQGFFVQNSGANPQVEFRDASKAPSSGTFYGKESELANIARFELNGEGLYNSMWIQFSNEGSLDMTKTDALELQPMNSHYAMLGTKKADGTIFDIGHYPIPTDEFEIPVSLETTRPGYFTITATDFDISFGSELYFIDLQEERSIRIDENFSYEFSTDAVAKTPGGDQFNRCSVNTPQKAKTFATTDRFIISTQPKDFTEIPAAVALSQNYPNPFNPTTQISYDLPQSADVRLEVYDLVGRQVATLVNQTMEAGTHNVNFDAANLSSGVYIYRLNAGNTVLSRKLTVIK